MDIVKKEVQPEYMLSFTDTEMKVILNLLSQINFKVQELKEHEVMLSIFKKFVQKQEDIKIGKETETKKSIMKPLED